MIAPIVLHRPVEVFTFMLAIMSLKTLWNHHHHTTIIRGVHGWSGNRVHLVRPHFLASCFGDSWITRNAGGQGIPCRYQSQRMKSMDYSTARIGSGIITTLCHHQPKSSPSIAATMGQRRSRSVWPRKATNDVGDMDSIVMAGSTIASDNNDNKTHLVATKTIDSQWNIPGLRKELERLILRCHKKIGKVHERLRKATTELDSSDDVQSELEELQSRMEKLNQLQQLVAKVKSIDTVLPKDTARLALELGVTDQPPKREPVRKTVPKPKGQAVTPKTRLPYRRYYSFENIEIRVGKGAVDNDELSISPEHRSGADWWMHASGCPGSHVVIRCPRETVPEEVVQDAACLAAKQSKCTGSVIKVSLTRCRDVKKPPGAKPGLVMLSGRVRTIAVNMKEAEKRLERLEKTVLVN